MTVLGELLEAVHDARRSLGSVQGTLREWRAALAGFQLWALPRPVLDVTYRPEPLESVTLTYDDATLVLTPASVRQASLYIGEPEQVERGDRSYWLRPEEIVFAEGETSIRLWHPTATGAELIDYAESLVPLP